MKTLGLIGIGCLVALSTTTARAEMLTYVCPVEAPAGMTQGTFTVDTQKHTVKEDVNAYHGVVVYQGSSIITFSFDNEPVRLDLRTGRTWKRESNTWVADMACVR